MRWGENFWLRLTTASARCLRLSQRFFFILIAFECLCSLIFPFIYGADLELLWRSRTAVLVVVIVRYNSLCTGCTGKTVYYHLTVRAIPERLRYVS